MLEKKRKRNEKETTLEKKRKRNDVGNEKETMLEKSSELVTPRATTQ